MSDFDVEEELNRLLSAIQEDLDEVESLVLESDDLYRLSYLLGCFKRF